MEQNRPKKLVLNRETLRELTQDDMAQVDGGNGVKPFTKGNMCDFTSGSASGDPCACC